MSRFRTLVFIPLVLLACAILGGIYGPKIAASSAADSSDAEVHNDLREFAHIYSLVEQHYAVPVDPSKAIYDGAIPGMLRELDPHSSFFDPDVFARMQEDQRGQYYGVGMRVQQQGDHTVVVYPFEATPAFRAGLRPGDIISRVDGKSTAGLTTDDVALLLKGPKGTTVHIAVLRAGHPQPLEFSVTRDDVHVPSVDEDYQLQPGVLYIHLNQFMETSADEIKAAIDGAGGPAHLKGLVLDLRDNPGGLLNEAVDIGDMFLAKGQVIVSHRGRNSPEHVYRAVHGNGGYNYPLVVIVNQDTASAAEIVSGAVQDHDRGLIIGQTTFGKGLVQSVFRLSDNTGLALTFAHYYTPSGRLIQRNYEGLSLWDYWNNTAADQNLKNREVKMTDSGRPVYGGGGITPDVVLPQAKENDFQNEVMMLADNMVSFLRPDHNFVLAFTNIYLSTHPNITRNWNPDNSVVQDFARYLKSQNVPFTDADIAANRDWIKLQVKRVAFSILYGYSQGLRVGDRQDAEIQKAVELLPQAEALNQRARQVIAARESRSLNSSSQP